MNKRPSAMESRLFLSQVVHIPFTFRLDNNDLSDLQEVKTYTISNSYFQNLRAYKLGRLGIIVNSEDRTLESLPSEGEWITIANLPDELKPIVMQYSYSISQTLAIYELGVWSSDGALQIIVRDGTLEATSRVPFTFCYITAS